MTTATQAKPIVKWAGGKQALARVLVSYFPVDYNVYFEPFLGGASVFLELGPGKAVTGDDNGWLIETYAAVREDWQKVAKTLDSLVNTKSEYLRIRGMNRRRLGRFRRAAHLVYLNKTCFRGLYRVNQQNQFNVPYGAYNRRYYDPENFESFANAVADVEFNAVDFELSIANATKGDFIYFDPPYYKQGGYADFNRYTPSQFRPQDHIRLAAVCGELDSRGIRWAVSNSDTEFVRQLFSGFRTVKIQNRREINLQSKKRNMAELLIMNYNGDAGNGD